MRSAGQLQSTKPLTLEIRFIPERTGRIGFMDIQFLTFHGVSSITLVAMSAGSYDGQRKCCG